MTVIHRLRSALSSRLSVEFCDACSRVSICDAACRVSAGRDRALNTALLLR